MSHQNQEKHRNYMTELKELMCRLRSVKMEPEVCNVRCQPLGCPRGPCPGICVNDRGCVDACCISKMPTDGCSFPPTMKRASTSKMKSPGSCCGRH